MAAPSHPLDRDSTVKEKAASITAISPWTEQWLPNGMYVVKTDGKGWEAGADRVVGLIEALGCGGWDAAGALHHVGIDLDVGHGQESDKYGSTEEALAVARQIRDLVGGAAEIRRSKGGNGIHVRVRIAHDAVLADGRKIAGRIAKWIAEQLKIKCDRTVLGRQNLWVWAREVGEHGFELVEACVGAWTPPPKALEAVVKSEVKKENPKALGSEAPVCRRSAEAGGNGIRPEMVTRAAAYVAKMPPAIAKNGGHDRTFNVVCTALQGFDLNETETYEALREWNERCDPPWNEKDLRHKIADAIEDDGPRGRLLKKGKAKADAPSAADIAERFLIAKSYWTGGEFSLRYYREDFWRWTGTHYERIRPGDMDAGIVKFLQGDVSTRGSAGPGMAQMVLSNLKALTLVSGELNMPVMLGDKPEPARDLIVLQNGVLDVARLIARKGDVLLKNTANLFSSTALPFEYQPGARCLTWRRFLKQIQPDPAVRRLLREWMGYCLVHDCSMQRFLMAAGDGANGKTVFCIVLRELLGSANVSAVGLEAFNPARTFPLAAMDGKLANICAEIGEMDRAAEGLLKQFVAGDPITVERKHRDPFSMTPTARLVFATNTLPRFTDRTDGLWRRLLLVPFNVQIPETSQDRRLVNPEFWRAELPAILNWALLGLRRLRRRGRFDVPAACAAAAGEYRTEANPARAFLQDHCTTDPNDTVAACVLYSAYRTWAEDHGHRPISAPHFGREVTRVYPPVAISPQPVTITLPGSYATKRSRVWKGLRYDG